jgi:photosystem II stability/assembly factor-like uncharacterized protein
MNAVKFINPMTGYAAGNVGNIMKTTDGGQNWNLLQTNKRADLYAIEPIGDNILIAAGDSGLIMRSTNAGDSWSTIRFQAGLLYRKVKFPTALTGYVCGNAGIMAKSTNGGLNWTSINSFTAANLFSMDFLDVNNGAIGGNEIILLTSNGGANWIAQNAYFYPFSQAVGVSYLDSNTIVAAETRGLFYKTTNRGAVWDTASLPIPLLFGGSLDIVRDMDFTNDGYGMVVCDLGSIVTTTNEGTNWRRDSSFVPTNNYIRNAMFWSAEVLSQNLAYVGGGGGTVIKTTNFGINWSTTSGGKKDISSIYFTSPNTGYTAGRDGIVLKTTDGGSTWQSLSTGTENYLRAITFTNEQNGYAVGDSGIIMSTTNAGVTWNTQLSNPVRNLSDVHFLNQDTGFICGGWDSGGGHVFLRTINAGTNWVKLFDTSATGKPLSIFFPSANIGLSSSGSRILRTTNGGFNWKVVAIGQSGSGNDVYFTDSLNGFCAGFNQIYKTTNAGLNWTIQFSGTNSTFNSICFASFEKGFAVGRGGAIGVTTNGGNNWVKLNSLTTTTLNSIFFSDSNTAYIAGEYGNILKTTTGGITFVEDNKTQFLPHDFQLLQNFPNPFNPVTVIPYRISKPAFIQLKVFNLIGKEVNALVSGRQSPGVYRVSFKSESLSSGVYCYSLFADGKLVESRKAILIK